MSVIMLLDMKQAGIIRKRREAIVNIPQMY